MWVSGASTPGGATSFLMAHPCGCRESPSRAKSASAQTDLLRSGTEQFFYLQQIQLWLLRFRHRLSRFLSSWFSLCGCPAGTFQVGKNFFGAIEDFFGQTGETGHLYAVTFVGTARDDFAEKNNLLVPFAHGDIQIADAFAVCGEFGQLVIMRRKQTARFDFVVEKLGHTPRDGEPVERRCAAADLVKND